MAAIINPAWGATPPPSLAAGGARYGFPGRGYYLGLPTIQNQNPPTATPPPPPPVVTEMPASGNVPPSTSVYAVDDPNTGDVVDPTATQSITTGITSWIAQNPILALGIAAAAVFLLMETFGGGHKRGHHRRY